MKRKRFGKTSKNNTELKDYEYRDWFSKLIQEELNKLGDNNTVIKIVLKDSTVLKFERTTNRRRGSKLW